MDKGIQLYYNEKKHRGVMFVKKLLILMLLLIVIAFSAAAESDRAPITVVNAAGEPVPGVTLIICTPTLCVQGVTDENGAYVPQFDLPDAEIRISAAPEGVEFDADRIYTGADAPIVIGGE